MKSITNHPEARSSDKKAYIQRPTASQRNDQAKKAPAFDQSKPSVQFGQSRTTKIAGILEKIVVVTSFLANLEIDFYQ